MSLVNNSYHSRSVHGVMLAAHSIGLLITGAAGIGKSETALALIDRGHQFISDDCVDLSLVQSNIIASCPPLIKNQLHIREIGVLNIKELYSNTAILRSHSLDLIIHLHTDSKIKPENINILQPIQKQQTLLGIQIPKILLRKNNTRDNALLIDILAKQFSRQSISKKAVHHAS